MTDPDVELLCTIRSEGSREALDRLVGNHIDRVRRTICGMVAADSAVDDLVQETFLRAIRSLPDFQGESTFRTWLTRIAINVALSHCESQQRVRMRYHNELIEMVSAGADSDPAKRLVDVEIAACVQQALLSLSPTLRAAIVLTVFEQMTPAQAAEVEQVPIGTMYWRIHEARRQLRETLVEHLE